MLNIILTIIVAIITILLSAKLWRMGGDGKKWARVLVGLVISLGKGILLWNPFTIIYWGALYGMTALFSYGVKAPPRKFWAWVLKRDATDRLVEVFTRATCGFFWSLAGLTFLFLGGSWIKFLIYSLILIISNVWWGLYKDVEVSERMVGGTVALTVLI